MDSALAAFGQRLQRSTVQDRVDAVADFTPCRAHRAGFTAMAWRRDARLLKAFDWHIVALDELHDVGHSDFRRMTCQQITAVGALLACHQAAALKLDTK